MNIATLTSQTRPSNSKASRYAPLGLLPEQVKYEARAYAGVQRLAARLQSMDGATVPQKRAR